MKIEKMLEKIKNYKPGTFVFIEWEKDISSANAKKQGISIKKKSSGLIRTKIKYKNLKNVHEKDDKSKKENWFEHFSQGILQHKKDPSKKYLQAFPIPGKKIKSITTINGIEEDMHHLYENGLINKSDLNDRSDLNTLIISIDKIINFGGYCNA